MKRFLFEPLFNRCDVTAMLLAIYLVCNGHDWWALGVLVTGIIISGLFEIGKQL